MACFLLLSFLLIAVAAAAGHAALPAEDYWNKAFPNTPMPSAIQDLCQHDAYVDEKGTAVNVGKGGVSVNTGKGTTVNVGKGGVHVNAGKGKPGGTTVNVGHGGVGVYTGKGKPGGTGVNVGHGGVGVHTGKGGTNVNVGHGGVGVHTGKGGTNVNVGHGGVRVNVPPKKKPVIVNVSPFIYRYAATETQVHGDPTTTLFFLEKDMRPGTKMTLHFTRTTSGAPFVPRRVANSVPFSSSKLPEILDHFSIQPNTAEADAVENTLHECEEPALDGESKFCATSLESMVELSTSSLGTRDVQAVSTTVANEGTPKQVYTIAAGGVQSLPGSKLVVCHAQPYAYAVFYCHSTPTTKAYKVALEGKDGSKVETVAVCHTDTAKWNPKHVAFQMLNVKPGSVPVCHFLPQDHLVWCPKK
ncbi:BURP domain-containing protein 3 isoform X1 [Iris pallida]|uniref:BURP domain-containing protein 3 isoform X1 n=1 Tax=Iris pallida TaxID=29817 RepID=A0AAX6DVJ4_IRIPA|nr:BURP domain-containing protein 3 isoform X1 [Iris pallida]KAJ6810365.1 BURP domain-containing protein 3 isoform X1 [Iris pallida]